MWASAKRALRWLAPHGVVVLRSNWTYARSEAKIREEARDRYVEIDTVIASSDSATTRDYASLARIAVDAGVDLENLLTGSISVESLEFVLDRIEAGPGLHIGNYAGLSLTYLAAHTDDLIVAVDPNVPH